MTVYRCWAFATASALLIGCGNAALPSSRETGLTALSAQRLLRQALPNYDPNAPRRNATSWMGPGVRNKALLYISVAYSSNVVEVYEYPSLFHVGTLANMHGPLGQCVDAKGDVYVVNIDNKTTVEFPHGGTRPLAKYYSGGFPYGCSVDRNGELAVTSFETSGPDPGSITVFKHGTRVVYKNGKYCHYVLDAGYDDKGNLVAEVRNSASGSGQVTLCGVLAGSKSLEPLQTRGITINFPDSTMWDGRYLALGDQEAQGFHTGIVQATLRGTTVFYKGETLLSDYCGSSSYTDLFPFFIVGTKNTPISTRQGTVVMGENMLCPPTFGLWHYPAGGQPFKVATTIITAANGESVSFAP